MSGRRARPDRASTAGKVRVSGLHPDAERTVVRLTDAALADVRWMARQGDPQVVRWALKKLLLLERDPQAGEPLRIALIGYRKLTVGDRDWQIVWRVTQDDTGRPIVDVAEVWAVGARSDSEMYDEMRDRVATLAATPSTIPLAEAIERLGRSAGGSTGGNDEPVADREPTAGRGAGLAHPVPGEGRRPAGRGGRPPQPGRGGATLAGLHQHSPLSTP